MKFLSKSMVSVVALSILWGASVYAMPGEGEPGAGEKETPFVQTMRRLQSPDFEGSLRPVTHRGQAKRYIKAKLAKHTGKGIPQEYFELAVKAVKMKDTKGDSLFDPDSRAQLSLNLIIPATSAKTPHDLRPELIRLAIHCLELLPLKDLSKDRKNTVQLNLAIQYVNLKEWEKARQYFERMADYLKTTTQKTLEDKAFFEHHLTLMTRVYLETGTSMAEALQMVRERVDFFFSNAAQKTTLPHCLEVLSLIDSITCIRFACAFAEVEGDYVSESHIPTFQAIALETEDWLSQLMERFYALKLYTFGLSTYQTLKNIFEKPMVPGLVLEIDRKNTVLGGLLLGQACLTPDNKTDAQRLQGARAALEILQRSQRLLPTSDYSDDILNPLHKA